MLSRADAVIHLAGINRPSDEREFETGNAALTQEIVSAVTAAGRCPPLAFTSSVRALEDTAYGRSKRAAEQAVVSYARSQGAAVAIYRLPNVFGKWSRPFYNSAVATFCHSIARDLPFEVHDPSRKLRLVYGEDVARALVDFVRGASRGQAEPDGVHRPDVLPLYERSLGEIVEYLQAFRAMRTELVVPDLSDDFTRKLYGTYVSFLPPTDAGYALHQRTDNRGTLAELLKSRSFGQVFVSRTHPGVTRGNHWHHTKSEKFVVVEGEALICLRALDSTETIEIRVNGSEFRVVDMLPGYTHSITNIGIGELITLFWASELFDPDQPDTYPLNVIPSV
jgi:UDP-2-acetamido-2,6-beta-L-arabino-hexul-4-ose reductase